MADEKQYILSFLATIKGDKAVITSMNRMERAIAGQRKAMGLAGKGAQNFGSIMSNIAQRALLTIPVWLLLRSAIMGVLTLIRNSVRFLIEWEDQMAQVRIVGKATEFQMNILSVSLLKLAQALGVSHKQLGEGAKLWAQQGRAISEIIPLMEATAKLSLISGRSISESVEDLTAVMKAYHLEATQSMSVVDSLTNVMLNHAVTAGTLAEGLRNVSSVASQMNVSFERLVGIITATHTVTRSTGSKVGLAWRTIFSRIATTASDAVQQIAKVPVFLDKTGKPTTEQTKNLRNVSDVLDEVALKWTTLSSAERTNLAIKLAGRRRLTELFALMGNYREAIDATTDAMFASSKSEEAINILSQTTSKRIEGMGQAWNRFIESMLNTAPIKSTVNFLTQAFDTMASGMDGLKTRQESFNQLLQNEEKELNRKIQNLEDLIALQKQLNASSQTFNRILEEGTEAQKDLAREESKRRSLALKEKISPILLEFGFQPIAEGTDTVQKLAEQLTKPIDDIRDQFSKLKFELGRLGLEKEMVGARSELERILVTLGLATQESGKLKLSIKGYADGLLQVGDIWQKIQLGQSLTKEETDILVKNLSDSKSEQEIILSLLQKHSNYASLIEERDQNRLSILKDIKNIKNEILSTESTSEQIGLQLREIELEGIRNLSTKKEILQKQLDLLNLYNGSLDDNLGKQQDALELQLAKLDAQQQSNMRQAEESAMLDQMRLSGASALQIEMAHLAILEQRKAGEQEIFNQKERIRKLTVNALIEEQNRAKSLIERFVKADPLQKTTLTQLMEVAKEFKGLSSQQIGRSLRGGGEGFQRMILDNLNIFTEEIQRRILEAFSRITKIDIPNNRSIPEPRTRDRLNELQKNQTENNLRQRPLTLPTPNFNAEIGNININLPENALDNMAENIATSVKNKLLSDAQFKRLFHRDSADFIRL